MPFDFFKYDYISINNFDGALHYPFVFDFKGINALLGAHTVDVLLSGVSPLTLLNAVKLNYVKAFGKCEQDGTPTPTSAVNIVCNNGTIKARHQSGLPLGYTLLDYIETDGNSYIDTNLLLSNTSEFEITFQSANATLNTSVMGAISGGTSYTSTNNLSVTYNIAGGVNAYSVYCDGKAGNAAYAWNGGNYADKLKHTIKYNGLNIAPTIDGVAMTQYTPTTLVANTPTVTTWLFGRNNTSTGTLSQSGVRIYDFKVDGVAHFVPCKNASNVIGMYDTVNGVFYQNAGTGDFVAGNTVSDTVEIYYDGTVETVSIDTTGSTATCQPLLSVGDYKDMQNVTTGAITRNIGVKVLDGSESFTIINGTFKYILTNLPKNNKVICNYFDGNVSPSVMTPNQPDLTIKSNVVSNNNVYFKYAAKTTVEEFKAWLASQYAAGTPVIVVYPLATPTTETVTGQTLTITQGTNIVTATGSVDDLELEISYKGYAELTVEEIEAVNTDESVEVTIS